MGTRGMPRNLLDLAALVRKYDQEAHAPFSASPSTAPPLAGMIATLTS
jgi:hypothetical protein